MAAQVSDVVVVWGRVDTHRMAVQYTAKAILSLKPVVGQNYVATILSCKVVFYDKAV